MIKYRDPLTYICIVTLNHIFLLAIPNYSHMRGITNTIPLLITASHVSRNPCLNFVVYVPPCEAAPLHIYRRQGVRVKGGVDAFLSPRWGGIVIHNPSSLICHNTSVHPKEYSPDTAAVMGVFLAQLRLLMGIPELVINLLEFCTVEEFL